MSSSIKTTEELQNEWGLERYVNALGILSEMSVHEHLPQTIDEMRELMQLHPDTFEIFAAYTYHGWPSKQKVEIDPTDNRKPNAVACLIAAGWLAVFAVVMGIVTVGILIARGVL